MYVKKQEKFYGSISIQNLIGKLAVNGRKQGITKTNRSFATKTGDI